MQEGEDGESKMGKNFKARQGMTWLTNSNVNGVSNMKNPLVEEAINNATRDVPEVTQVRSVRRATGDGVTLKPLQQTMKHILYAHEVIYIYTCV
jgi:hypothetical protein